MIKKLWLKLVLLYTGITGLILALCLGITFFFSCNRYEASLDAQICDQIESYQIKLLSSRQVDQSTLQELEENLDGNIYIFENGTPLFRFEPTGGLTPDVLENIFRSEHSLSTDELSQASNGWTSKKDERNTALGRFHVFYFRHEDKTQIEILALQSQSVRLPFIQHGISAKISGTAGFANIKCLLGRNADEAQESLKTCGSRNYVAVAALDTIASNGGCYGMEPLFTDTNAITVHKTPQRLL